MPEHFGQRLQRLREERGWTVYAAAKRTGMVPWVLLPVPLHTCAQRFRVPSEALGSRGKLHSYSSELV
jgi:transcriptional regulator with XRE-family HTH domain